MQPCNTATTPGDTPLVVRGGWAEGVLVDTARCLATPLGPRGCRVTPLATSRPGAAWRAPWAPDGWRAVADACRAEAVTGDLVADA